MSNDNPTVDAFDLALECADAVMTAFSEGNEDWQERRATLARTFMPAIIAHENEVIK